MSQLVAPSQHPFRPGWPWPADREIQVCGDTCFPEHRWREAFLYYLFGVWGNKQSVVYRPKMILGSITLRLWQKGQEYYAYGRPNEEPPLHYGDEAQELHVGHRQAEVEQALIRFVKNKALKVLVITLNLGVVYLWKKRKNGEYGVSATGLPVSWGSQGPIWE